MHRASFWFARPLAVAMMVAATTLTLGTRDGTGAEQTAQQADRLGQLETFARTAQEQWDVPGMAIAIVKDDEVIYAKGFGVKRVSGTEPVEVLVEGADRDPSPFRYPVRSYAREPFAAQNLSSCSKNDVDRLACTLLKWLSFMPS